MTAIPTTNQYGKTRVESSSGVRTGIFYLLVGGCVGAVTALLLAPKSGSELRSDISDVTRKGYDETLGLARNLKGQSSELYQTIRGKTDGLLDLASSKFGSAQEQIDDSINSVESNVDQGGDSILQLADDASRRPSGTGRRSTSIV